MRILVLAAVCIAIFIAGCTSSGSGQNGTLPKINSTMVAYKAIGERANGWANPLQQPALEDGTAANPEGKGGVSDNYIPLPKENPGEGNGAGAAVQNLPWPATVDEFLFQAKILEYEKDYLGQIVAISHAIELDSGNYSLYVLRSNAYIWNNDAFHAEIDARKAISLAKKKSDGYVALGNVNAKIFWIGPTGSVKAIGAYSAALSNFSKAQELKTRNGEIYVSRAVLYQKAGKYSDALLEYITAMNYNRHLGDEIGGLSTLARLRGGNYCDDSGRCTSYGYSDYGRFNASKLVKPAYLPDLPANLPNKDMAGGKGNDGQKALEYMRIADAYLYNWNWSHASYYYKQAEIANPFDPRPFALRAVALEYAGENALADGELSMALKQGQNDEFANHVAGVIYKKRGEWEKAILFFGKAVEKNPDRAEYYLGRGLSHMRNQDESRARADLEKYYSMIAQTGFPAGLGNSDG